MGALAIGAIVGLTFFIQRMSENARLAKLWRGQQGAMAGEGPSFTLTYKVGKKVESSRILASSEGEALKIAMKHGIPVDKLISLEQTTR